MSNELITTKEHKGYTAEVYPDYDTPNPREDWDGDLAHLVLTHPRYNIGDYAGIGYDEESLEAKAAEVISGKALVVPVTMLDHSSVSLAPSWEMDQYRAGMHWDMSFVGLAIANYSEVREMMNWARVSAKRLAWLRKEVEREIRDHGAWLNGEIYSVIIKAPDGNEYTSCGGIVGAAFLEEWIEAEIDAIVKYEESKPSA